MESLKVECPHCSTRAELFVEGPANMVLLKCSHCHKPILYFHGETLEVDEKEISKLKAKELKAVEGFMKLQPKPQDLSSPQMPIQTHHKARQYADPITSDNITDLRILLETTEDVGDFLQNL